ncbi:hypothetical protein CTZ27_33355 [Streptomyces griseocarneus]|nr:hypothetical protein CTZ27_33355 [Streptomyces griseocarneus]
MNPLWMISVFVGLSETAVVIAASQAEGWVQGLLAIFSVTFPILVSGAFFGILWKKPEVLYAPGDFPEHLSPGTFRDGIRGGPSVDTEVLESVVRRTLESVLPTALAGRVNEAEVPNVVNQAFISAQRDIASRMLRIDTSAVHRDLQGAVNYPVDDSTTVSELLNWLWRQLTPFIRPYTYGSEWVLRDRLTGRAFDGGTGWARSHGRGRDERLLTESGITPGMDLAVELIPRDPTSDSTVPSTR